MTTELYVIFIYDKNDIGIKENWPDEFVGICYEFTIATNIDELMELFLISTI